MFTGSLPLVSLHNADTLDTARKEVFPSPTSTANSKHTRIANACAIDTNLRRSCFSCPGPFSGSRDFHESCPESPCHSPRIQIERLETHPLPSPKFSSLFFLTTSSRIHPIICILVSHTLVLFIVPQTLYSQPRPISTKVK